MFPFPPSSSEPSSTAFPRPSQNPTPRAGGDAEDGGGLGFSELNVVEKMEVDHVGGGPEPGSTPVLPPAEDTEIRAGKARRIRRRGSRDQLRPSDFVQIKPKPLHLSFACKNIREGLLQELLRGSEIHRSPSNSSRKPKEYAPNPRKAHHDLEREKQWKRRETPPSQGERGKNGS